MDFITGLNELNGCNAILTIVDRFTKLVKLAPLNFGEETSNAEAVAELFFR